MVPLVLLMLNHPMATPKMTAAAILSAGRKTFLSRYSGATAGRSLIQAVLPQKRLLPESGQWMPDQGAQV